MMQRLFAEAIHQLGGTMTVNVADLEAHRGKVQVSRNGDILTATFSAPKGESQPMYACKDCGRQATKEQVFSAAEKCKDLSAMMQGLTPWQCTMCRLAQTSKPGVMTPMKATPLNLASIEEIMTELWARYDHCIVAFQSVPVEGVNEVAEGLYHKGNFRLCQGLAMGIQHRIDREILKGKRDEREELEG